MQDEATTRLTLLVFSGIVLFVAFVVYQYEQFRNRKKF